MYYNCKGARSTPYSWFCNASATQSNCNALLGAPQRLLNFLKCSDAPLVLY